MQTGQNARLATVLAHPVEDGQETHRDHAGRFFLHPPSSTIPAPLPREASNHTALHISRRGSLPYSALQESRCDAAPVTGRCTPLPAGAPRTGHEFGTTDVAGWLDVLHACGEGVVL